MAELNFENVEKALEYSHRLGKNQVKIATVEGKPAFICSTLLPLERRLRQPIEDVIKDFLREVGITDEDEIEDTAMYIGADISTELMKKIEYSGGIKIVCPYDAY